MKHGMLRGTVFVASFLLFALELAVGKAHLPLYGGSPAVWSVCLVFFAAILLGGYATAHLLAVPSRRPLLLLFLTISGLKLFADLARASLLTDGRLPDPSVDGSLSLLVSLVRGPGLALFLLALTLPLLSRLAAGTYAGRGVFTLAGLSNAGALTALVVWPLLLEPWLGLRTQEQGFLLLLFLWFCSLFALSVMGRGGMRAASPAPPPWGRRLHWMALSATGNILLLAVSQKICQDVSVVPFLWVLPLAAYLVTWVIAFRPGEREGEFLPVYLATAMLPVIGLNLSLQYTILFPLQTLTYLLALFSFCLVIHTQLQRLRPAADQATVFYLDIALGGLIGSFLAGLLAPQIFSDYFELHWGVLFFSMILLAAFLRGANRFIRRRRVTLTLIYFFVPFLVTVAAGAWWIAGSTRHDLVVKSRSFFGLQRVIDQFPGDRLLQRRVFFSQNTIHGLEKDPRRHPARPNAYYGPQSGVGRVILALQRQSPSIFVGDIGLGVGTLAAYARRTDRFLFCELNPHVIETARRHFHFLSRSAGRIDLRIGDGRLVLSAADELRFDLLVLDAFLGDGIPTHLLTAEAFRLYRQRLGPDGVIAVNVSNLHLNLLPVLAAELFESGWFGRVLRREADVGDDQFENSWALLAATEERLQALLGREGEPIPMTRKQRWTDDHSALRPLLRWLEAPDESQIR